MQTRIPCGRMLALATLVAFLQACSDPTSSSTGGADGGPVRTSEITINMTVESKDLNQAVVRANLNDGQTFGSSFRLDGGDYLEACASGVCRAMADNDSVFTPDYVARFNYQSDVDFVVSFNRRQAANAPDSRVSLPPPFVIVTPANHQQVTDGDTVLVEWTPTGAPARVALSYTADCTFLSGQQSASTGTLSVDTNRDGRESVRIDPIVTFAGQNSASRITRCSIDIIVEHERDGRIDPAFDGGHALGIVERRVNLDYIPR
jgi:hypothetical protein